MKGRRPPYGLVLCGADRVVRVDVDDADSVVRTEERTRPVEASTAEAAASVLGGDLPARVFVLDERLWTQTVTLPAAMVDGLTDAQIERALSYELEPLSGVRAAAAAVGFVPAASTGGERRLWVTVVPAEERDRLAARIAERGARLAGVGHPAGAAHDGVTSAVEVWERATGCFPGADRDDGRLVLAAAAGQRSWERGLSAWLEGAPDGTSVEWSGRARAELAPTPSRPVELLDRGPLAAGDDETAWLARALRGLTATPPSVPLVRPPAPARRTLGPRAAGGVLLAVVLLVIVADATRLVVRARALSADEALAAGSSSDVRTLQRSAAALEARHQELMRDVQKLEREVVTREREWAAQRSRLRALLDAAAALRPDALVLESLAPTAAGEVTLAGKSVEQAAVDRFADDLGDRLAPAGWKIRPAAIESGRTDLGAPYFAFAITAVPTRPEAAP